MSESTPGRMVWSTSSQDPVKIRLSFKMTFQLCAQVVFTSFPLKFSVTISDKVTSLSVFEQLEIRTRKWISSGIFIIRLWLSECCETIKSNLTSLWQISVYCKIFWRHILKTHNAIYNAKYAVSGNWQDESLTLGTECLMRIIGIVCTNGIVGPLHKRHCLHNWHYVPLCGQDK